MEGFPPIGPVAWPKPEKTGAGGAAGAGAGASAPVACPKPENPGIPVEDAAAGAGASPVACPKPEKPGTPPEDEGAGAGTGAGESFPGRYPARACPCRAVLECWNTVSTMLLSKLSHQFSVEQNLTQTVDLQYDRLTRMKVALGVNEDTATTETATTAAVNFILMWMLRRNKPDENCGR